MIAERGTEIWFLIFFWIDMGMLLGPVLLLELRVCIKLAISSGDVGVMKNDSTFGFLRLPEKFLFVNGMCFWSSLLIDVKCIQMFCNIFWLTNSSAIYEKKIQFPCLDFWFTIDYFIDPVPNCFTISSKISYSGILCFSLGGQQCYNNFVETEF